MLLARSFTRGGRALVRQHHRQHTVCMGSAAGPGAAPPIPPPPAVCVHAASPAELAAAQQQLQQGEALVALRGTSGQPDLHCTLLFPDGTAQLQQGAAGSSSACGTFRPDEFLQALETRVLGRVLLTADTTPSTQVLVQENVTCLPDGLVFVADRQLGGKGRGGNRWESPGGCLMFTAVKRLAIPGQRLPFVQYIVSLAVAQAVQAEAAARLAGKSIDVRIKWPNDLYAGPLKLGGILCHSSYRDQLFHIVIGVGLNLSNREPTTCVDALIEAVAAAAANGADAAGGAGAATGPQQQQQDGSSGQQQQRQQQHSLEPVGRERLLAGILSRLEPMLEQLAAEGFGPFEADYCRHWLHSDQQVLLEEGGRHIPVTIRGLSPNGYLLAVDGAGERYELHPDGNSLDFFKGLVRKKLPA
ncbi:biotin-- ligase 2-like [Chlorella sorokiniana]|uniref:Biotin--ligase 2-like n=1 Tax=Chlorella sorokiniana TaxID=3076 RepID=A0A2P6TD57_CHLSO|nr:biotin-- ligase 2-like [Chlorella sorokiniana]|eukprot:PRW20579.1 biotin-- ligase 2-like [Chlorella sorokiniana]